MTSFLDLWTDWNFHGSVFYLRIYISKEPSSCVVYLFWFLFECVRKVGHSHCCILKCESDRKTDEQEREKAGPRFTWLFFNGGLPGLRHGGNEKLYETIENCHVPDYRATFREQARQVFLCLIWPSAGERSNYQYSIYHGSATGDHFALFTTLGGIVVIVQ